jgi:hypothetical protein
MTLPASITEQVRRRADHAYEYCGVTEVDSAGELSVDHFRPRNHGGADDLANLLYCCFRCNFYKADYWPEEPGDPMLWNPRQEPMTAHLLLLADGTLHPITPTGVFTLGRLRLNRPQLVTNRLRRREESDEQRLSAFLREQLALTSELYRQQAELLEDHRALLAEQRFLLRLLLDSFE